MRRPPSSAPQVLEPVKARYPWISYADLWTLAGAVAIEGMGGEQGKGLGVCTSSCSDRIWVHQAFGVPRCTVSRLPLSACLLTGCRLPTCSAGPTIPWRPGRVDKTDGSACPPDGRLPDAAQVGVTGVHSCVALCLC
jgi:hypothetical protein